MDKETRRGSERKKKLPEKWFCFHRVGLTSLHSPSVSTVRFVEIEKSWAGPLLCKVKRKQKRSKGKDRGERWEGKRGGKKARSYLLSPIGLSVIHSPFLSAVDFVGKRWKKTFESGSSLAAWHLNKSRWHQWLSEIWKLKRSTGFCCFWCLCIFSEALWCDVLNRKDREAA